MPHAKEMDSSSKAVHKDSIFTTFLKDFWEGITGQYVDVPFKATGVIAILILGTIVAPVLWFLYTTQGPDVAYQAVSYLLPGIVITYVLGYLWVIAYVYRPVHQMAIRVIQNGTLDFWPDPEKVEGMDLVKWGDEFFDLLDRDLNNLGAKAEALSRFDFDDEALDIDVGGELGHNFDEMKDDIETLLKDHRGRINERLSEQGKEIENSSSAVTELSQSTETIFEQINKVGDLADNGRNAALEGAEFLEETIDQMNSIQSEVSSTTDQLRNLVSLSDKIDRIVDTVSTISEQTSLLALNAAVEAARAGEEGKGFAVVADEVSDLADRTGEATDDISELVQDVQEEIDLSVQAMESVADSVEEGVTIVDETGGQLDEIVDNSTTLKNRLDSITETMQEHSSAADEIAETVEAISAGITDLRKEVDDLLSIE